jgi:hypothetical protein
VCHLLVVSLLASASWCLVVLSRIGAEKTSIVISPLLAVQNIKDITYHMGSEPDGIATGSTACTHVLEESLVFRVLSAITLI